MIPARSKLNLCTWASSSCHKFILHTKINVVICTYVQKLQTLGLTFFDQNRCEYDSHFYTEHLFVKNTDFRSNYFTEKFRFFFFNINTGAQSSSPTKKFVKSVNASMILVNNACDMLYSLKTTINTCLIMKKVVLAIFSRKGWFKLNPFICAGDTELSESRKLMILSMKTKRLMLLEMRFVFSTVIIG